MSRDSRDAVAAWVEYDLEFSNFEAAHNISFNERVVFLRRRGNPDQWALPALGGGVPTQTDAGDPDETVAVLQDATLSFSNLDIGELRGTRMFHRSFSRNLTPNELLLLLERGQDRPYVVVSAIPADVIADVKVAAVRPVDLGDPVARVTTELDPTGLTVTPDGNVWVAATDNVSAYDRTGSPVASALVDGLAYGSGLWWIQGGLWSLAFGRLRFHGQDGYEQTWWSLSDLPGGGATDGTMLWITIPLTNTVIRVLPGNEPTDTTALPGRPAAIAATSDGGGRAFVATADGQLYVIDTNGNIVGSFGTDLDGPHDAAVNGTVLALAGAPTTRLFQIDPVAGTSTGSVGIDSPSNAVCAGAADDLWIAFEDGRLVRYDGTAETGDVYELGVTPSKVLWDGDRVFVLSRASQTLSIVQL